MKVRLISIDSAASLICTIFLVSPKIMNSYRQKNTYLSKQVIFLICFGFRYVFLLYDTRVCLMDNYPKI